jgi:pathogenicity locus Cdd1 protein
MKSRGRGPGSSAADRAALADLQRLSGVGPSIARDLVSLGFRRADQLRGQDPLKLYHRLERLTGSRQDPCVLDTFACAVWHAEHPRAKPRKWWEWSRKRLRD